MKKVGSKHVSPVIVTYKLVTGIIELFFGFAFLFLGRIVSRIYISYRLRELLDDPHDLLISIVQKIIPTLIHYHTYLIVTFIVFGLIKTIGAIALFYDKEWGLDLLILFFFLMLPFDIYTLFSHITLLKSLYFLVNVLITLYLIEFKPHTYFWKYIKHVRKLVKN